MRFHTRALMMALVLAAIAVASHATLPSVLTYTYTYEGSDEARLVRTAQMRALKATVGRLYFSDNVLIAQDILERYLDLHRGDFVAGVTILDRVVDQDRYRLRMDVSINAQQLEEELQRFRFLVTPRPTPLAFIFMNETVDTTQPQVAVARSIVAEALQDAGLEVSDTAILSPDSRIDVGEAGPDPEENRTLATALNSAQRAGVELLFTGQATTTLTDNPQVYYDTHYYYSTQIILRMFRVDTGELLGQANVGDSGAHSDDATAREISIRKAVGQAVNELMAIESERWAPEILNEADYRLMITDIGEDDLSMLEVKLGDINDTSRVFRRSHYGNVACLNLLFSSEFAPNPGEERSELVDYLENLNTPQLRIESIEGSRITASVVH